MNYERTCEHCGTPFRASRPHARFCAASCRTANFKRSQPVQGQVSACPNGADCGLLVVRVPVDSGFQNGELVEVRRCS